MTPSKSRSSDDGSNWVDYEARIWKAMGAKGLLRIVEGTAIKPVMYRMVNGAYVGNDGKIPVTEDQVEAHENKIEKFDRHNYLVQHIICQSVSPWLGSLILNLKSTEEMWEKVKSDSTKKSTLHLIDTKEQLLAAAPIPPIQLLI
jgi:hypothetical protein